MSRKTLAQRIEANWYRSLWRNIWLLPLWLLVAVVTKLKRFAFIISLRKVNAVPVVVVGNINVGGTGKTPLIVHLVQRARALGLNPGIVSRGYGGKAQYPLWVNAETPVTACGDEPRLLQSRLNCPVVVDPARANAVLALSADKNAAVDIIFSDDGLQHYAMNRDAEIIVVDGRRLFGNGWLLPVGPLRESTSRLSSVDLVLVNGIDFYVEASTLINARTGEHASLEILRNKTVDAVAGIGNPERFYRVLNELEAHVIEHSFADHHAFNESDFAFNDESRMLIMTEKDWVKCQSFAKSNWWYLPVDAKPNTEMLVKIDELLKRFVKEAAAEDK